VFTRTAEQLREQWTEVGEKPQKGTSILKFGLFEVRSEIRVKPLKPIFWLKASRVGHRSQEEFLLQVVGREPVGRFVMNGVSGCAWDVTS
jgi:hypothetical protein